MLLFIIFFIFRIAKPDATRNFVSKVKNLPHTISWWFHHDWSDIDIDSVTNSISWDIWDFDNYQNDDMDNEDLFDVTESDYLENSLNSDINDLQWLENFDQEIKWASESSEKSVTIVKLTWDDEKNIFTKNELNTWDKIESVSESKPVVNKKPKVVNYGCWTWFSKSECEEIQRELWNFD